MDPIDVLQFDGCTQGHVHIVRDCTDEMRGIFEPWGLDVTDVPDADIAIWEHAPALLAEVRQLREDVAKMQAELATATARADALEKAGDELAQLIAPAQWVDEKDALDDWAKAKEMPR